MKSLNDVISGVDEVLNSAKHGNFEEVLSKTKNYAEKATKMSVERLEVSRKKIELLDSKTKLAKAYENYGKLQYSVYEGADVPQEEIDACIAEITLLKNRADFISSEIEALKDAFTEPLKKEPFWDFRKNKKQESQDDEAVDVIEVSEVTVE